MNSNVRGFRYQLIFLQNEFQNLLGLELYSETSVTRRYKGKGKMST